MKKRMYLIFCVRGIDYLFPHLEALTDNKEVAQKIANKLQEDRNNGIDFDKTEDEICYIVAESDYPVSKELIDALKQYNKKILCTQ